MINPPSFNMENHAPFWDILLPVFLLLKKTLLKVKNFFNPLFLISSSDSAQAGGHACEIQDYFLLFLLLLVDLISNMSIGLK